MIIKLNGYYIKNLEVTEGMEHEAVFGDLYYKNDFICSFVDEGYGGGMVAEGLSDEHFRRLTGILDRQELLPSFCRDGKNFVVDVFVTNLLNLDMFVTQFKKDCEKNNIEESVVSLAVEKKEKWNDII